MMGLLDKVFGKNKNQSVIKNSAYWKLLNGYTPIYTTYNGGLYEMAQTKAIINTIATDCAKAIPQLARQNKKLEYLLQNKPNEFMTTTNFIERLVVCYLCDNNAFIIPITDEYDRTIGLYPIAYSFVEIKEHAGKPYAVYTFGNGEKGAMEMDRVGFIKRMQYKNDVFGDSNSAIHQQLEMIHSQNQSITNALKNSGIIRFMAQINEQLISKEDFEEERKLFSSVNFGADNNQMMIYDSRYKEIKQVESKPIYLDEHQQALIDENIRNYFGGSVNVIQHKFTNDYEWNSYYEGVIEPILIKIGEALTNMLFTPSQIMSGQKVYMTTNRLQYMSNQSKLEFSTSLFDRGVLNGDDVCDVWQLPHYEGGDKHFIRREYAEINKLDGEVQTEPIGGENNEE